MAGAVGNMKCSYCGGNTRWTETFCGGSSMFNNTECGAPLHRPGCNRERDCDCPNKPFTNGEIDKDGKVFHEGKGWTND